MFRLGFVMAWNVFKFCAALRVLGSIMILLVLAVVGFTYYAVVVINYLPAVLAGGANSCSSFATLIIFHLLMAMLLWSYFSAVLTDPGTVPLNWRPNVDEESGGSLVLNGFDFGKGRLSLPQPGILEDSGNLTIRYCRKCKQLKPPRCHHCSACERCILKMDHHCVWIANCVGALNYKFFLLFLFYTLLETSLVTIILLSNFIAFFNEGEIPASPESLATTFLTFVLNLAFALSVLGLLVMHLSLVSANTTTIEAYEKKPAPKWRYDLGRRKNFEQVFGINKRYWLIPAYSEEDLRRLQALYDLDYPSKPELDSQNYR